MQQKPDGCCVPVEKPGGMRIGVQTCLARAKPKILRVGEHGNEKRRGAKTEAPHRKSLAYSFVRSLRESPATRATPKRAVRVGNTLSYMSAPSALHTNMSIGYLPAPTCTLNGTAINVLWRCTSCA